MSGLAVMQHRAVWDALIAMLWRSVAARWDQTNRPTVRSVLISGAFDDAPWAEWCRVWLLVGAMAVAECAGDRETERRRGGGL